VGGLRVDRGAACQEQPRYRVATDQGREMERRDITHRPSIDLSPSVEELMGHVGPTVESREVQRRLTERARRIDVTAAGENPLDDRDMAGESRAMQGGPSPAILNACLGGVGVQHRLNRLFVASARRIVNRSSIGMTMPGADREAGGEDPR
jgi:hypothetical protein